MALAGIVSLQRRLAAMEDRARERAKRLAAIPAWVRNPPLNLNVIPGTVPRWVHNTLPISYS